VLLKVFDHVRRSTGDDHGLGVHQPAIFQEFRDRRIAIIDLAALSRGCSGTAAASLSAAT
jgi:hypothetical protein